MAGSFLRRNRAHSSPFELVLARWRDPRSGHQFFVDVRASPARSIWTHPYDDPEYLQSIPDPEAQAQGRTYNEVCPMGSYNIPTFISVTFPGLCLAIELICYLLSFLSSLIFCYPPSLSPYHLLSSPPQHSDGRNDPSTRSATTTTANTSSYSGGNQESYVAAREREQHERAAAAMGQNTHSSAASHSSSAHSSSKDVDESHLGFGSKIRNKLTGTTKKERDERRRLEAEREKAYQKQMQEEFLKRRAALRKAQNDPSTRSSTPSPSSFLPSCTLPASSSKPPALVPDLFRLVGRVSRTILRLLGNSLRRAFLRLLSIALHVRRDLWPTRLRRWARLRRNGYGLRWRLRRRLRRLRKDGLRRWIGRTDECVFPPFALPLSLASCVLIRVSF
jgi:hypothetical protein